jgi:uncharacterized protein YcbK (DUF882 family)
MIRLCFVLLALVFVSGGVAEAGNRGPKMKVCSVKEVKKGKKTRKKRSCSWHHEYEGSQVKKEDLRTEPLEKPSGELNVRSDNLQEELTVQLYGPDGALDEAVLAQLDEISRCKRTHHVRAMDARLYEQLARIYDHFGKQTIILGSGFRDQDNTSSRHYHASAIDFRIKGVSPRELYDYAVSLDTGGMGIGIYPNTGHVHIDYRAPGERSSRWTDWSYPDDDRRGRKSKKSKKKRSKK